MKGKVVSLLLFFFLVSTVLTSAVTIEDLALYTSTAQQIDTIGLGSKSVELRFIVRDTDASIPIRIDLSQFYALSEDLSSKEVERPNWVDPQSRRYRSDIDVKSFCNSLSENNAHSGYACQIPNIKLQTSIVDGALSINFDVGEQISEAIPLAVDNQRPSIVRVTSNYCTNEACYVGVGVENTIQLVATDNNPLEAEDIQYTIAGRRRPFATCDGGTCTGSFPMPACSSGQEFRVTIQGTDAYGNPFESVSEPTIFVCDEKIPGSDFLPNANSGIEIDLGTPPIPFPNYKNGDEVLITARITEDTSGVKAFADLNSLQGTQVEANEVNGSADTQEPELTVGNCELETANIYACTWRVTATPGTHELSFIFEDNAGHATLPENEVITVDEFDTTTTTEELHLFRNIEAQPNSPKGYSRLAIDLAVQKEREYPIYAIFTPAQKNINDDIEILRTTVESCVLENPEYEINNNNEDTSVARFVSGLTVAQIEIPENNQYFRYDDNLKRNSLDIRFNKGILDSVSSEFNFICGLEVVVKKDDIVLNSPAKFNVTIPVILRDSSLGSIGEVYAQKIKDKEEYVGKDSGILKIVGDAGKILNQVANACSVVNKLATVNSVISSTETLLTTCAATTAELLPTSQACASASRGLGKVGEVITKPLDLIIGSANKPDTIKTGEGFGGDIGLADSGVGKWIGIEGEDTIFEVACKLATCSGGVRAEAGGLFGDDLSLGEETFFSGDSDWGTVGNAYKEDLLRGAGQPDITESVISAVEAQCLPGIIYHIEKYREMECTQLACYKWAAQMNLDISMCDRMKAQSMCMAITSEIFAASPTKKIEDMVDNFNTIIQNSLPSVIKNVGGSLACKALKDSQARQADMFTKLSYMVACELPKSIGQVSYQLTENSFANNQFQYPDLGTCDFALCNGDSIEDCMDEGTVPPFLQQYVETTLPVQDLPDEYDVDTETIRQSLDRLVKNGFEGASERDLEIFSLFSGFDYNDQIGKANRNQEQIATINENALLSARNSLAKAELALEFGVPISFDAEAKTTTIQWGEYKFGEEDTTIRELGTEAYRANQDYQKELANFQALAASGDIPENQLELITIVLERGYDYEFSPVSGLFIFDASSVPVGEDVFEDGSDTVDFVSEDSFEPLGEVRGIIIESETAVEGLSKVDEANQNYNQLDTKYQGAVDTLNEKLGSKLSGDVSGDKVTEIERVQEILQNEKSIEQQERDYKRAVKLRDQSIQDAIRLGTNMVAQYLLQQGDLQWLQWEDGTGVGRFLEGADDLLNSEKRKQFICNELVTINSDDDYESNIIQCNDDNFCAPVLSFAAERVEASSDSGNDGYLYTALWFIGNVEDGEPGNEERFLNYNVVLRGGGPEIKLHTESDWAQVRVGRFHDNVQMSTFLPDKYDRMCFIFEEAFPPNSATTGVGSKSEFCRDIQDITQGEFFDTGDPVPEEFYTNYGNNGNQDSGFKLGVGN